MPEPNEIPLAAEAPGDLPGPVSVPPLEPVVAPAAQPSFPAWSAWDVLAVLVFTGVVVFAFSLAALFIAHRVPGYRDVPASDLASVRWRSDYSPLSRRELAKRLAPATSVALQGVRPPG